jgi:hypothetical protein
MGYILNPPEHRFESNLSRTQEHAMCPITFRCVIISSDAQDMLGLNSITSFLKPTHALHFALIPPAHKRAGTLQAAQLVTVNLH